MTLFVVTQLHIAAIKSDFGLVSVSSTGGVARVPELGRGTSTFSSEKGLQAKNVVKELCVLSTFRVHDSM